MNEQSDDQMAMRSSGEEVQERHSKPEPLDNPYMQQLGRNFIDLELKLERWFSRRLRSVVYGGPQRREMAEDGAMEVMKRACVNLARREAAVDNLEAFIMGIARRYWGNEMRPELLQQQRNEVPLFEPEDEEGNLHFEFMDSGPDMESVMISKEMFRAAWEGLSYPERMAIRMKAEGYSAGEAMRLSEGLWLSEGEYHQVLRRAREKMRKVCERRVH